MTHDIVGLTNQVESRESYVDAAARFACAGATAVVVDAPWSRDPDRSHDAPFTFTDSAQNVEEMVQMITDLRRAVDVLEQMGAEQIGFTATGSGASYGAMLAGVEPRIDAFSLLGGGAGPVARYIGESGSGIGPAAQKTAAELQAWADLMRPLAPANIIGGATSPILFAVGRDDQVFTVEELKTVRDAARNAAELRVYDAGRTLNAEAFHEQLDWLADHIGLDHDRVDACFEDVAAYVE